MLHIFVYMTAKEPYSYLKLKEQETSMDSPKKEEKISTSNEVIHVRAFRGKKKPVNLIL